MNQAELIFKVYVLVNQLGVCPKTKPADWVKTLLYLHSKGWLWVNADDKGEVLMAAAMYRIPEVKPEYTDKLPEKEEGKILYVPFFVSVSKDVKRANKVFKTYLKRSIDIDAIAFYERGDDTKLKMFKRKGVSHGKVKVAESTADSNVPN